MMDRPARPTPEFELAIGRRWADEATRLQSGDAARWVPTYDVGVLRAHVDVVIRGRNLTADLPDEPALGHIRAWAAALDALARGAERARVEWTESPFEVALQRRGDLVLFSLFELGAPGWFRAEREAIPGTDFLDAVRRAARDMARQAAAADLRPAPELATLAARLPRALPTAAPEPAARPPLVVRTTSESGLEFETRVDLTTTGLADASRNLRFDRHLLLADGESRVTSPSGRALQLIGRPLRLLEDIVDALEAAERRGDRRDGTLPLTETASGLLRLRSDDGRVASLELGDPPAAFDMTGFEAAGIHGRDELSLTRFIGVMAEHAESVVDALVDTNAALAGHSILAEMHDQATRLRQAQVAPSTPPVRLVNAAHASGSSAVPEEAGGYGFAASAIRRMRYERLWTLALPGAEGRSARFVAPGTLFVAHRRGADLVDAEEGRILADLDAADARVWAHGDGTGVSVGDHAVIAFDTRSGAATWRVNPGAWQPGRALTVGAGAAFVSDTNGTVRAFSVADGALRWEARSFPGVIDGVEAGDGRLVVASAGRLFALDAATGAVIWSVEVPYHRVSFRVVGQRCVVVADDPLAEATRVGVLDLRDGAWERVHEAAVDVRAVGWAERGVAVLASDGHALRVVAVDVSAGTDWTAPVLRGATDAGESACMLDADGVVGSAGGRVFRLRPGGVVWQVGDPTDPYRMARRTTASGMVFAVGEASVRVLASGTGRELHRIPAFWERLQGMVADDRGHLLMIEDVPGRGTVLHGVRAVGMIAALDGGKADAPRGATG